MSGILNHFTVNELMVLRSAGIGPLPDKTYAEWFSRLLERKVSVADVKVVRRYLKQTEWANDLIYQPSRIQA